MLNKMRKIFFPNDARMKELRESHAKSVQDNTVAREKLLNVCEEKIKKTASGSKTLKDIICIMGA